MYEDLEQIAQLKFGKEMESISGQTREKVTATQSEYAARAPFPDARSGPHEAAIGQVYIDGAERLVRALCITWVNLIRQRKGHNARSDVEFIAGKVSECARKQKGHLETVFRERRMGPARIGVTHKAETRMRAVAIEMRRDLEIMAREHEAFPDKSVKERGQRMTPTPKRIFSPGRRVLVGLGSRPGTIVSVDEQPSVMGEFRHIVKMDNDGRTEEVLGCDIQGFPRSDRKSVV